MSDGWSAELCNVQSVRVGESHVRRAARSRAEFRAEKVIDKSNAADCGTIGVWSFVRRRLT
eukprot:10461572-Lingulodinium_polyedra.AAC.1